MGSGAHHNTCKMASMACEQLNPAAHKPQSLRVTLERNRINEQPGSSVRPCSRELGFQDHHHPPTGAVCRQPELRTQKGVALQFSFLSPNRGLVKYLACLLSTG